MTLETVRQIQQVEVGHLCLDRENPRLVTDEARTSDESIIARLYRAAELEELLQSISANGYMDIEPLIGLPGAKSTFVVLEGNRRLAALRLLREPDLVGRIKLKEGLSIGVPQVEQAKRRSLDRVSVYPVDSREDARSFIGFKHINGPAKWGAYAKAKFAAQWYKSTLPQNVKLAHIANAIGDRHDTIKRMISAIYVLEQASAEDLFRVDDRYGKRFSFSHLYTALGRSPYRAYLGIGTRWAQYDPRPNPIPREKFSQLKQVLLWIYGSRSEDVAPVVQSQNPHIRHLGEVLAHAQGRHVLEITRDLDAAHAAVEPVDRRFTASLIRARAAIGECANSLRAYDGRDQSLLDIAADIKEMAGAVWQRMKQKSAEADHSE